MERMYKQLNEIDQMIIKNILEQTEFDLEDTQQTSVFEKSVKDAFYYFIFTKDEKIWEPICFAYHTKLEPIHLFQIRSQAFKIICFKGTRKLKRDEVAYVLTQMVRNASLFYIPKQIENMTIDAALSFLEKEMIDESGQPLFHLDAKSQLVMKLLFASGFLHEMKFCVDVIPKIEDVFALVIAICEKEKNRITIADLKTAAFTDEFIESVRKIFS